MAGRLVTLTTDFGDGSPYVAAMKGVILGIDPSARLVDLGHGLLPQDVRHAAFFLAGCLPFFPPDTIHVVVVDPGVGTARALLHVEAGGQHLLVPDNGCWTLAVTQMGAPRVHRLAERRFWRESVSSTFHGRDILAPVAAHLARGVRPEELGPVVSEWVELPFPRASTEAGRLRGEVVFVDHYGNLISNIPGAAFRELGAGPVRVRVGRRVVTQCVDAYAEADPGTPVALVSSGGWLEVAVNRGNAAAVLKARVGTPVEVVRSTDETT
jgi:S-adenosyl-L-methionine hydrolase (adenosine-forming)